MAAKSLWLGGSMRGNSARSDASSPRSNVGMDGTGGGGIAA